MLDAAGFTVFFHYYYSQWGETESLATAATTGLLYQVMVIVEKLVE
jgi:hypothetical protein